MRVQRHIVVLVYGGDAVDVFQFPALAGLGVLQHGRRRPDGGITGLQAETGKVAGAEVFAQRAKPHVRVECQGIADVLGHLAQLGQLHGHEYLVGPKACDLRRETVCAGDGLSGQFAAAEVQGGQAVARQTGAGAGRDADQQAFPGLFQQRLLGDGSRRDDALHPPFHRALALRGIADLLADGHRDAERHQFGEIAVDRVMRHPGHGNGRPRRLPARRQRDIEQFRGPPGVGVEEFVEVSHAVEQEVFRVLRLDAQVLLHHGRVLGAGHAGGFCTNRVRRSSVGLCYITEIAMCRARGC